MTTVRKERSTYRCPISEISCAREEGESIGRKINPLRENTGEMGGSRGNDVTLTGVQISRIGVGVMAGRGRTTREKMLRSWFFGEKSFRVWAAQS